MNNNPTFIFFGTDDFSVIVLNELEKNGFIPSVLVTVPDKPKGRKLVLTPPETKVWADKRNILVLQPEKLNDEFVETLKKAGALRAPAESQTNPWDLFIAVSYGLIIPKKVLDIPTHGTLNVHPSLLPLYRGASPIESAMLDDRKETGVTIMKMDAKMDHGPILSQEIVSYDKWPTKEIVRNELAQKGGEALSKIIPMWLSGEILEQEQDHLSATYTKKIVKADGEIFLDDLPYKNFLKIQAYNPWPGAFFFVKHGDKKTRVKITSAKFEDNKLIIERVIPEGKKEMSYEDFNRGFHK